MRLWVDECNADDDEDQLRLVDECGKEGRSRSGWMIVRPAEGNESECWRGLAYEVCWSTRVVLDKITERLLQCPTLSR